MAYVVQEDILASINETINVRQGESQTYSISLHRDNLDTMLTAERASSISVAIVSRTGRKVLMFANPQIPGVTQPLVIGSARTENLGIISFEITDSLSRFLEPGNLQVIISITYADFYPNAKTYVLPLFKIGQVIETTDGTGGGGGDNGGGGTGGNTTTTLIGSPMFEIEHTDLSLPSSFGMMSVNDQDPLNITEIIFRNLDKNKVRSIALENFLVNRMDNDKIDGVITLYSTTDSKFFTIYKILEWSRVDITNGNGNSDNTDGIKIKVLIESISNGPGVTKELWQVGDKLTFSIDTFGVTVPDVKPSGILTFADKKKIVTKSTNGNGSTTGVFITYSPYEDSYVMVEVNGISVDLGSTKLTATTYFSGNNGVSASQLGDIRAGDQLIWNGKIAGFELELGDEINLIYEVDVNSLK